MTLQPILQDALFWWDKLVLYVYQQPLPASVTVVTESGERCSLRITNVAERRAACEQLHVFLKHIREDAWQRVAFTPRFHVSEHERLMVGRPLTVPELKS